MRFVDRSAAAVLVLVCGAGAVACGGGSDAPSEGAVADTATGSVASDAASVDETPTTGSGSEPDSDSTPEGESWVRVTLGDETIEASNQYVCITIADSFTAQYSNDDETFTISIALPPLDWETDTTTEWDAPSIRVDDGRDEVEGFQWVAGVEELSGADGGPFGTVSSFSIDGMSASGEMVLVDNFDLFAGEEPATVAGSFEASCT